MDDLGPGVPPTAFPDDNGGPGRDDELEQKTKTCDVCRGRGSTSDGVRCSRCSGSGRVPIDPDDPDDDEEDDDD
jgi:hypothetical protein